MCSAHRGITQWSTTPWLHTRIPPSRSESHCCCAVFQTSRSTRPPGYPALLDNDRRSRCRGFPVLRPEELVRCRAKAQLPLPKSMTSCGHLLRVRLPQACVVGFLESLPISQFLVAIESQ